MVLDVHQTPNSSYTLRTCGLPHPVYCILLNLTFTLDCETQNQHRWNNHLGLCRRIGLGARQHWCGPLQWVTRGDHYMWGILRSAALYIWWWLFSVDVPLVLYLHVHWVYSSYRLWLLANTCTVHKSLILTQVRFVLHHIHRKNNRQFYRCSCSNTVSIWWGNLGWLFLQVLLENKSFLSSI